MKHLHQPLASLLALLVIVCLGSQSASLGQNKLKKYQQSRPKLSKIYEKWLTEDVAYLITKEETDAFLKLQTDEEREQFIEDFWLHRDPNPDTLENEYREEIYRRIAYANEHFASGIPGWKTDRGRMYITFGPPDSIEAHPAGGPYERPYYEGGGSTSTYPFEIWFYRHLEGDGLGSGLELEFVDPTGSGEYRLSRDPEEKDALLYTPNGGLTLSEQLGFTSKANRPFFNPANRNNPFYNRRAQDEPFEKIFREAGLFRPPTVRYRALAETVEKVDQITDFGALPFSVRTDFIRAGETTAATIFTVQLQNADLAFKNLNGIQQATVNIFARINTLSSKRVGIFEDPATVSYPEQDLPSGLKQSSVYQKSLVLPPGRYKIDLAIRDVTSGHTGIVHHTFEVPSFKPEKLMTSSLVMADILEPLKGRMLNQQFMLGSIKVRPNVSQVFYPHQNLGVYLQVYNVQIDQTTLKPAVDVEYVISRQGQEILRIKEDGQNGISDLSGYAQQITLGRTIPLKDFQPGSYEVTVSFIDKVSRQTLSPKTYFTLLEESPASQTLK